MNSGKRAKRSQVGFLTSLALLSVAALWSLSSSQGQVPAVTPGCENTGTDAELQQLFNKRGLKDFANPPEPSSPPTSEAARLDLIVDYSNITVLGCTAKLRTYNGMPVGPTIHAKPGDTIHLRLINRLPAPDKFPPHPQQPEPTGHGDHGHQFSFNITNLHNTA